MDVQSPALLAQGPGPVLPAPQPLPMAAQAAASWFPLTGPQHCPAGYSGPCPSSTAWVISALGVLSGAQTSARGGPSLRARGQRPEAIGLEGPTLKWESCQAWGPGGVGGARRTVQPALDAALDSIAWSP